MQKTKNRSTGFDEAYIRQYMALPAEEKFEYLYKLNKFTAVLMPAENKKALKALQAKGW